MKEDFSSYFDLPKISTEMSTNQWVRFQLAITRISDEPGQLQETFEWVMGRIKKEEEKQEEKKQNV